MGIFKFGHPGEKMITIRSTLIVFAFILLSTNTISSLPPKISQEDEDLRVWENYLKSAEIITVEADKYEGRTAPWAVTLDDGSVKKQGIFKYVNRPRPTLLPDSYHYEIAAYKVSQLLNLMIVPPVVEREVQGTLGSLQMLVEGCFPMSQQERKGLEPPDPEKFSDALEGLFVFESLVQCEREPEDVFIHEGDWKVYRVDFSEAFAPVAELFALSKIRRCSKKLFQNLLIVEPDEIKATLQSHLNEEEMEALLKRRELILERIKILIQEKGEESILF
jgi:hypothetical protein